MSYDLTVYGSGEPDGGLASAVESVPGLALGERCDGELKVVRGKRQVYAFTVFGPYSIEPDDVPAEVVAAVLGPDTSWQVVIEGSETASLAPARRFAKALALRVDGVAVDEQTGELLGSRTARRVEQPARSVVSTLDLTWYSPDTAPADAVRAWLAATKSKLPEAVPRRFGNYEPLQYKLERDGEEKLLDVGDDLLMFKGVLPCLGGAFYRATPGGLRVNTLALLADPLSDPRWRAAVRGLFVDFAQRRRSLLATGEICRNLDYLGNGRVSVRSDSDLHGQLTDRDGLLGLDPHPIWWTWFGADYLPLLGEHLPGEHVTVYDEGVLYAPVEEPADRRELAELPDPVPAELRVTERPLPPNTVVSDPYLPATTRPR